MVTQSNIFSERFKREQKQKIEMLKLNGAKVMNTSKENNVMKLYGIYDKDMGLLDIFQQPNDALAKRNFSVQVNTDKTPFYMFPDRFEMWKIGEVDKETGEIKPDKYVVAGASELKNA